MRRLFICLLLFLLVPAYFPSRSERRADTASSSKGLTSHTCGNNPGPTDPYSNRRFSLGQLSATTTSGLTYVATTDVYAWGDYNCSLYVSGNPASGENPATEDTILAITLSTTGGIPASGSYKLLSFRLNNYLPVSQGPGFISCQNNSAGVTPCDNQSEDDFSPVPEPAPISGADGNGLLWTFGDIFQISGISTGSTPGGPPLQLTATPPDVAAALLVPGCAPDPAATPPQNCIGTDKVDYGNGLSPRTTYTVEIQDTASGQILVLGTPAPVQPVSGKGHDVFSATNYSPVAITGGVFANQVYDLSANYPQLDGTGTPAFDGFAPSSFPPPCAGNSGVCTANDTFANESFHAMWFDFVPLTDNPVSVNTAFSHFDTILSVFTGSPPNLQAVPNGLSDDNPNATIAQSPQSSAVIFQGARGVTYHILVSEYPAIESVNPEPTPGFNVYKGPLSPNPILYFTLTTPQLTASPSMLNDFGSVAQGTDSAAQTITLATAYSAASLGISNIVPSITAGASDFQIASNSSCLSSLADQAACTLNIAFSPSAPGTRSGTLTVSSSAENSPLTFSLSGNGVAASPVLELSSAPLSFGTQLLNTPSNTSSVVLKNTGSAAMTISAVSTSGEFGETNNCSSIAAGGQCSVAVTFTPAQTGLRSGQLSITSDASNSPQHIPLSGTGTDFALQAASGSQLSGTVAPGATATYNIAVAPIAGFTGTVALSCAGSPTGGNCSPSPASVSVNGSVANITVSVAAPLTATLAYPRSRTQTALRLAAAGFPLAFGLLAGKKRRKCMLSMVCLGLLLSLSGFMGCGGGQTAGGSAASNNSSSGGTNPSLPVTSTLTLTGTSGTQTRHVALTLTVQ